MQGINDRQRPEPEALIAIEDVGLQRITLHPFGQGALTPSGDQYSSPATSGTAENTYATAALATANPSVHGDLMELEFKTVAAIRSEGTAGDITWKWQVRDIDLAQGTVRSSRTFIDLFGEDSTVSPGTAFFDSTAEGYFNLSNNVRHIPLEIQLLVKSTKISDGVAKAKNRTYVSGIVSSLYNRTID